MEYIIKNNVEYNSVEIYFNMKPAAEVRDALKGLRMRWNGAKRCWYGYTSAEAIENALKGGKPAKAEKMPKAGKKYAISKEDRETIRDNYLAIWGNDAHMVEWATNKADKIIKLSGGRIVLLEKQKLETHFCYGYGFNGISTREDIERAGAAASRMDDPQSGEFIRENLEKHNDLINSLNYVLAYREYERNAAEIFKAGNKEAWREYLANNEPDGAKIHYRGLEVIIKPESYYGEKPHNLNKYVLMDRYNFQESHAEAATDEEIKLYIEALEEQRAELLKRCEAYLKRYGTSKLHTWTYLRD